MDAGQARDFHFESRRGCGRAQLFEHRVRDRAERGRSAAVEGEGGARAAFGQLEFAA